MCKRKKYGKQVLHEMRISQHQNIAEMVIINHYNERVTGSKCKKGYEKDKLHKIINDDRKHAINVTKLTNICQN